MKEKIIYINEAKMHSNLKFKCFEDNNVYFSWKKKKKKYMYLPYKILVKIIIDLNVLFVEKYMK